VVSAGRVMRTGRVIDGMVAGWVDRTGKCSTGLYSCYLFILGIPRGYDLPFSFSTLLQR
jgi:hypothetical protein